MRRLNFTDWLKLREVGTGSNCVAVFARPVGGMVSRAYPDEESHWGDERRPKKKKGKRKKKKSD
jgi:hypothetical protein